MSNVKFETGAERGTDAIKGWHMLSQIALRRYCDAMQEGATKYTPYNWLKGIPVHNLLDHIYSHLAYFLQGDATEDHLGHALWNLAAILHYSETRLDLFEGLPPGCKEGMLLFLQSVDEGNAGRDDSLPKESDLVIPQSEHEKEVADANRPDAAAVAATGHEPLDMLERDDPQAAIIETQEQKRRDRLSADIRAAVESRQGSTELDKLPLTFEDCISYARQSFARCQSKPHDFESWCHDFLPLLLDVIQELFEIVPDGGQDVEAIAWAGSHPVIVQFSNTVRKYIPAIRSQSTSTPVINSDHEIDIL